jgi:hypothetical protein
MNGKKVYDKAISPVNNEILLDLDFLSNGISLAILKS